MQDRRDHGRHAVAEPGTGDALGVAAVLFLIHLGLRQAERALAVGTRDFPSQLVSRDAERSIAVKTLQLHISPVPVVDQNHSPVGLRWR